MSDHEFGSLSHEFPDYPAADVPRWTRALKPAHWHNDTCPSWTTTALDGAGLHVFADYVDPTRREIPENRRFTVLRTPALADHTGSVAVETDNEQDVIVYLLKAKHEEHLARACEIAAKWVARLGGGFHPDTPGANYVDLASETPVFTAEEAAEYDAEIEELFGEPGDPYAIAVSAMEVAGLGW